MAGLNPDAVRTSVFLLALKRSGMLGFLTLDEPEPEEPKPTPEQIRTARDFLRANRPDLTREQVEAEAIEAATAYFIRGERT